MARIVVAMSGGVDSSVAAALLKEQGHEVIGMMLRLWSEPGVVEDDGVERVVQNKCCSLESVDDARRVARKLDIPFYLVNVEQEFKDNVVDYFYQEYVAGRTPNPCLTCNRHIRFTLLLNRALALDADYLATGHYVRVDDHPVTGKCRLRRGLDPEKDQSYVLHVLTINATENTLIVGPAAALEKTGFTVGNMHYVSGVIPGEPFQAFARIRYKAPEREAIVTPLEGDRAQVILSSPQRAITPGQ